MAVKCFRQALQSLKESSLSDNQKTLKSHEITAIIKELRTVHGFNLAFEGADASERKAGLPRFLFLQKMIRIIFFCFLGG